MRTCLFCLACFSAQLTQAQIYYVRFPDDVVLGGICALDNPASTGQPVLFNPDSLPLVAVYEDAVFGITPACFTVTRSWRVFNPETYDPMELPIFVPNPSPHFWSQFDHPDNLIGPVVSPVEDPSSPWQATVINLSVSDTVPTNFAIFWDSLPNAYHYSQQIHILDTVRPLILNCPVDPLSIADTTENDPLLWHEPYWSEPNVPGHDMRESPVELSIAAYDSCSRENMGVRYLLFLDLDQDGVQETVVRSYGNLAPGTVNFGNAGNPDYSGGTPRVFDERSVPDNQKYRFTADKSVVGGNAVFVLRWNTAAAPSVFHTPQLPPGTHKIRWSIEDGCGNTRTCEYTFVVVAPAVAVQEPEAALGARLFPIEPNPAGERARIRFFLPEATFAKITVRDAVGRPLFEKAADWPAGEQSVWFVPQTREASSRLLACTLECAGHVQVQKMILK